MKVIYDTLDLEITTDKDSSLLELCIKNKIPISHSCEGMASCGTCRVIILSNIEKLPIRNELENDMAEDRNFKDNERLACQLIPECSFRFKLPED